MYETEHDVLIQTRVPRKHRTKFRSTIHQMVPCSAEWRANAISIFSNRHSLVRLLLNQKKQVSCLDETYHPTIHRSHGHHSHRHASSSGSLSVEAQSAKLPGRTKGLLHMTSEAIVDRDE